MRVQIQHRACLAPPVLIKMPSDKLHAFRASLVPSVRLHPRPRVLAVLLTTTMIRPNRRAARHAPLDALPKNDRHRAPRVPLENLNKTMTRASNAPQDGTRRRAICLPAHSAALVPRVKRHLSGDPPSVVFVILECSRRHQASVKNVVLAHTKTPRERRCARTVPLIATVSNLENHRLLTAWRVQKIGRRERRWVRPPTSSVCASVVFTTVTGRTAWSVQKVLTVMLMMV